MEKNLSVSGCNNIVFQNSTSKNAGTNALSFIDGGNILIEQDSILNTNNNAIYAQTVDSFTCQRNYIKNTAITAGRGASSDGQYCAMQINGYGSSASTGLVIQNNDIDSVGYLGIAFYGYSNVLIKNNFVNHYDLVKDDGGGIYTWSGGTNTTVYTNRKIISNIVLNAVGAFEGTDNNGTYIPAEGIYMDDNVSNVEITGNTVAHCKNNGIFFHNAHEITLNNNTVFDAGQQMAMSHDNTIASQAIKNCVIKGNILFSKNASQPISKLETVVNDINTFGVFDSNYYCRPFDDRLVINTSSSVTSASYDLDGWKLAFGKDLHSVKTPLQFSPYTINSFSGNNLFSNGAFNNNINGLYCYTPLNNCNTVWDNAGILDGGSLKCTPGTSNPTYIIIGIGAVSASENYILKFSLKGSTTAKSTGIFLRQSLAPYQNLTPVSQCVLTNNRTENEFLFSFPVSENDASIVFEINADTGPVWIDNINLQKANITQANPDDSIRFEYNATELSKTISLSSNYIDVKGNPYSGSVTLQPFSSIILMQKSPSIFASTFIDFKGSLMNSRCIVELESNQ